jgi:two-component system sensor histidine kinase HydH
MALSRLVENLARNAVEAMEAGGTLSIGATLDGDFVRIEIADTGKGMAEQDLAALFEPFRTAGKVDGTGLGLGIVARVAEGHGGHVDVRSAPGAGTTFVVTLPLKGPPEGD